MIRIPFGSIQSTGLPYPVPKGGRLQQKQLICMEARCSTEDKHVDLNDEQLTSRHVNKGNLGRAGTFHCLQVHRWLLQQGKLGTVRELDTSKKN